MKQKIWLFFLLILICAACSPTEVRNQVQASILLNDPVCNYPCWQNIYPGKTTFAQAVDILTSTSSIDSTRFSPTPSHIVEDYGYSSWIFKKNIREIAVTVFNVGDSVGVLQFSVNRIMNISEMIDFFGEPELISIISGVEDSRWLEINWIYPSNGVMIELYDYSWKPQGNNAYINSEMKVFHVRYFDPENYESLMGKGILISFDNSIIQESIQPWKGYGLYSFVEE